MIGPAAKSALPTLKRFTTIKAYSARYGNDKRTTPEQLAEMRKQAAEAVAALTGKGGKPAGAGGESEKEKKSAAPQPKKQDRNVKRTP